MASVLVIGVLWIPATYAQQPKMAQVDESFNGRQVELYVGETLVISLSENASTGFQWIIAPESAHNFERILHERKPAVEGTANPLGKPGVRHFSFEAFKPGTAELELHYRRPWETAKPPGRKFKLRIRVRPASGR
jgi:inhibitor of cysteine peptidase